MSKFLLHINGVIYRIMKPLRNAYHKNKRGMNDDIDVCILCNNCTGGVILHDLGLKFNTPTINTLFYSAEDFIDFCKDINYCRDAKLEEAFDDKYSYPLGKLKLSNGKQIIIGFVHYKTFESAKIKWEERFKRFDANKAFIVLEGPNYSSQDVSYFHTMEYNKIIISSINEEYQNKYDDYIGLGIYDTWYPGKLIDYKNRLSVKRFLDEVDYKKYLKRNV